MLLQCSRLALGRLGCPEHVIILEVHRNRQHAQEAGVGGNLHLT